MIHFWELALECICFICFQIFSGNDDYANTPLGILVILATTIFITFIFGLMAELHLEWQPESHLENDSGTPLQYLIL